MGQIACSWLSVMFIELTLARPSSGTGNTNCSGTWGTGRCLSVRVLTLANQLHLVLCLHPNSSLTAGFLAEASLPTSLRTYRSDWDSVVHTVCFFLRLWILRHGLEGESGTCRSARSCAGNWGWWKKQSWVCVHEAEKSGQLWEAW